jgi:CheY-like chemotaxis protein
VKQNKVVVILVDDDEFLLRALVRLVTLAGFKTLAFSRPGDLLKAPIPTDEGCIVLDLFMPEMDGVAVSQYLKAVGNRMPLILITGRQDERSERMIRQIRPRGRAVQAVRHIRTIESNRKRDWKGQLVKWRAETRIDDSWLKAACNTRSNRKRSRSMTPKATFEPTNAPRCIQTRHSSILNLLLRAEFCAPESGILCALQPISTGPQWIRPIAKRAMRLGPKSDCRITFSSALSGNKAAAIA